jgi:hypothetical protein
MCLPRNVAENGQAGGWFSELLENFASAIKALVGHLCIAQKALVFLAQGR